MAKAGAGVLERVEPEVTALELRHAVAAPANAHPRQIAHLQQTVGNRAVQRLAVQRLNDVETNPGDTAIGVMDTSAVTGTLTGSAFQLPEWKNASYAPSTTAAGLSTAGGGMGVLSNLTGMGIKSKEVNDLRKQLKTETDPVARRALERQLRMAGGDVAQKVGGTLGSGADLASGAVNIAQAGTTGATIVGGVAAGVALPLQLWAGIREFVRALRQRKRVKQLEKVAADWERPKEALAAKKALVAERQKEHDTAIETKKEVEAKVSKVKDPKKVPKDLADQLATAKEAVESTARALADEKRAEQDMKQKAEDMQEAITKKASGTAEPSLQDLALYAKMKNERGLVKKTFSIISSTLGIGGSIALIVAAAAGGAALMATPVGWALAGAAAAIGLAVGIYKLVKWFKRRKSGVNERKVNAETLFKYGLLNDLQGKEARKLIHSLGAFGKLFDPKKTIEAQDDDLRTSLNKAETAGGKTKESVIKLLMAKLAS